MAAHILMVEDDEDIADFVAYNLQRQGWTTTLVHDGRAGLEQIRALRPDLVILDIMLPGMDGLQIYRAMKELPHTAGIPTLFLTARAQLEDRLEGLQLGADDYMTKPFSPRELVLDKNTLQGTLRGEPLELTTAEFKLLAYLMERPGRVQDRYELQKVLFGYADTTQSRALDTHVKRLRRKLGEYAECVTTERGVGYCFSPKEQL